MARDASGKFEPGTSGNPKGKPARGLGEFRDALRRVEGVEGLEFMARLLYTNAQTGDPSWFKLWAEYRVGKPAQAVSVETPDGDGKFRLRLMVEDAAPTEEVEDGPNE